jgi:hypothetical protein
MRSQGPGWSFAPIVVGPEVIPIVRDLAESRGRPLLALLSVIAHGGHLASTEAVDVAEAAWSEVERHAEVLSAPAQLEFMRRIPMRFEPQSTILRQLWAKALAEGRTEGEARGRAEGEALAILRVLAARRVEVPAHVRRRILGCGDRRQLDRWVARAATATTAAAVFASPSRRGRKRAPLA